MTQKLVVFLLAIFASTLAIAQTEKLPKDHLLAKAAPNLPMLKKYSGEGIAFHFGKNTYNKEESEARIIKWLKDFPQEADRYKKVAATYFKSNDAEALRGKNVVLFGHLEAQWIMIRQLLNL